MRYIDWRECGLECWKMDPEEFLEWDKLGKEVSDAIVEAVKYYCTEVATDKDPLECLKEYKNYTFTEIVVDLYDYTHGEITDEDIDDIVDYMPRYLQREYTDYIRRKIEDLIREAERNPRALRRKRPRRSR